MRLVIVHCPDGIARFAVGKCLKTPLTMNDGTIIIGNKTLVKNIDIDYKSHSVKIIFENGQDIGYSGMPFEIIDSEMNKGE